MTKKYIIKENLNFIKNKNNLYYIQKDCHHYVPSIIFANSSRETVPL